jgi:heme/copper-type cytochrome/quinol oxidase subunit 2
VNIRRLELLQWFGFLAGGVLWFASFVAGASVAVATCNPAGKHWSIPYDTVQIALLCFAVAAIGAAELAAVLVFRSTRRAADDDAPPPGRMRFFSICAMTGNVLFLAIIVLSIVAAVVNRTCLSA